MKKFKLKLVKEQHYKHLKTHELYDEANNHIGERVWVHTERTQMLHKKNGLIGVYKASETDQKTGNPYFKTNAITLEDCVFRASVKGSERIVQTGKRTIVAGCVGTIVDLEEPLWNPHHENSKTDSIPAKKIDFNPDVGHFFVTSDPQKRKIVGANYVYFTCSPELRWTMAANGIRFGE